MRASALRLILAAPLLVAAGIAAAAGTPPVTVTIANFTFDPPVLTVTAGTEVTFVNQDDIPHLVAAEDGSFRSPPLDTDDRFTRRFDRPGEVAYFCSLHPHMTGRVKVVPAAP